jgi:hypothetical protein
MFDRLIIMAETKLKTILWVVFILFILLAAGATIFIIYWVPPGTGGEGIKIAVLDSGIALDVNLGGTVKVERELRDTVIAQKSFVTTEYGYDTNLTTYDNTPTLHGTRVAVTIAGRTQGIASASKLIIARCTDTSGTATYAGFIAAFQWAVYVAKADIVNVSLGGGLIHNDSAVTEINKAALEMGVLTVISAGNSGDANGYETTSIESPANALQGIAVGALTLDDKVAAYSSMGPLKDHSIKPDLVDNGFSLGAVGTSYSAPKVTGKAAVLMSWCRAKGYLTNPGLIKAALMKSARKIPYSPIDIGAGIPDVSAAKTVVDEATRTNGIPAVSYILPTNLPIMTSTLFQGDIWHFPLTIISSLEQEFTVSSTVAEADSIVDIRDELVVNQTTLVNCSLVVPAIFPEGLHEETIILDGLYSNQLTVDIACTINEPTIRLGFDVYHSKWFSDHLFGQFNEFRAYFNSINISLVELTHPANFSSLATFDGVILADPNSYGIRLNGTFETELFYQPFDESTIISLVNYVDNGGGLFIASTTNSASNITEVNKLLSNFELELNNVTIRDYSVPETASINQQIAEVFNFTSHPITQSLVSIDCYGAGIDLIGPNAEAIAWSEVEVNSTSYSEVAVAIYESPIPSAGRVVLTGTNFMLDNYGVNNEYKAISNLPFLIQVAEWITNTTITFSPVTSVTHQINEPIVMMKNTALINCFYSDSVVNSLNSYWLLSEQQKKRSFFGQC